MTQNENKKMFVVQIKPNSNSLAERNLKRQGFETFAPKMIITKRKNNKFIQQKIYVFPGYIFVYFNPQLVNWSVINSTYGVSKIISFNKKPSEIKPDLARALKKRYEFGELKLEDRNLVNGDLIKINTGPFSEFFAKIEKLEGNNRIWALLELSGKKLRLRLSNNSEGKYTIV